MIEKIMQQALEELEKMITPRNFQTHQFLRQAIAEAEKQEQEIEQLIRERDHAHEIIDKLCDAVLGVNRYEWSSMYFFEDAVREVEEKMAEAEKQKPVAWIDRTCLKNISDCFEPTISKKPVSEYDVPLYTSPPQLQEAEKQVTYTGNGSAGREADVRPTGFFFQMPEAEKQVTGEWKLVPRNPTEEMLVAMDECAEEGYDERLYAGMAASVFMAAVDAAPNPPQRQPLTDEQIDEMWAKHCIEWKKLDKILINPIVFARAIEAKLKEKNT